MDTDPELKPEAMGIEAWVEAVRAGQPGPQAGTTRRAAGGLFQVSPLGSCACTRHPSGLRMFVWPHKHRCPRVCFLYEMTTAGIGRENRDLGSPCVWGALQRGQGANPTV